MNFEKAAKSLSSITKVLGIFAIVLAPIVFFATVVFIGPLAICIALIPVAHVWIPFFIAKRSYKKQHYATSATILLINIMLMLVEVAYLGLIRA